LFVPSEGSAERPVVIGSTPQTSAKPVLRVLLIEDSLDDADLVLEELRPMGRPLEYERVDSASGLRAALAKQRWQLVLCDYSLPSFDAPAALAIIAEHRLDLPFIIISGAIGEETAVAAMRAGAHDFLIKGKLARLVPAVERELREAEVRAERATMQQQLLVSDRLVQLGTLAAGVAHEINNPLAYVIGNIAFALEELSEGPARTIDSRAIIHALQQALQGSERIRETANDLRVFSRTDDSEPQPVELRRVLESSISMAWNQIRHRARLIRDYQDLPLIAANENRLGQVFLNLLINAAQAIPEGNAEQHEIRVSLREAYPYVEIEVSDTGVGIAPEIREHLFQPFFTTKPKGVGTGLGLSICQKIVQDCGGDISARPNPAGGTTFRVRLRAGTVEPVAKPPRPTSDAAARRGRVLVIDDEPAIVEMVGRILRAENDTVGAVGARAALELLHADTRFDVILCDLMMPDMSGAEFYDALHQRVPHLSERIIFLSGGAFTVAARLFLNRIDNPRVQKPFDPKALRAMIREQLGRLDTKFGASARE
jgi:signal transduction histidine kinase